MLKIIDDIVESVSDVLKPFLYFFIGMLIVGLPLFIIAKVFELLF